MKWLAFFELALIFVIFQDQRSVATTAANNPVKDGGADSQNQVPKDYYLSDLKKQLSSVCASNPASR